MSRHEQPNGRPIHPECRATADDGVPCTCDVRWDYWDGTDATRRTAIYERLENRGDRKHYPTGASADADEAGDGDAPSNTLAERGAGFVTGAPEVAITMSEVLGDHIEAGNWKESERLRCAEGKPFAKGDYNYDRHRSGTWARAAAASNQRVAPPTAERAAKEAARLRRIGRTS